MINIFLLNTSQLQTLSEYKEIIDKDSRFPKNYWDCSKNQSGDIGSTCSLLTRFCLENLEQLCTADLPGLTLKDIKKLLVKNKLSGMLQRVYSNNVLDVLKNAYKKEFDNKTLHEWMWSCHGTWSNPEFVVEAVTGLVRKEGLKEIEDIPQIDWKKRLVHYGIYNILSYYDWSIYNLFDFVYPNKFHPADFKYRRKWKTNDSLRNASYLLQKTFRKNGYSREQVLLLSSAGIKKLGLAGMVATLFHSSVLAAKEYYFFKTIDNPANKTRLTSEIREAARNKQKAEITVRLEAIQIDGVISNLHSEQALYSLLKRQAKVKKITISELLSGLGFKYASAARDNSSLSPELLWDMRSKGLTYVQIADKLSSNPTTISQHCKKYFGADPLIPRPLQDYATVQELMEKYHVDHKTVMKLVYENNLENNTTIRFRYLKKTEIEPLLQKYTSENAHHKKLVSRYA